MKKIRNVMVAIITCSVLIPVLPVFGQESTSNQVMQQEITPKHLMKWQGSGTYHCGNSYVTILATVTRTPSGTTSTKVEVTSGNGYIVSYSLSWDTFRVSGYAYANASGQFYYNIELSHLT